MNVFAKEPAFVIGAITAALVLAVQFGVPITDGQQDAIKNFATAMLVLGGAWWTRQNVASPATLRDAGTSLKQVSTVSQPDVDAQLRVVGPDATQAPK